MSLQQKLEQVQAQKEEAAVELAEMSLQRTTRANSELLATSVELLTTRLRNLELAEEQLEKVLRARTKGPTLAGKAQVADPQATTTKLASVPANLPLFRTGNSDAFNEATPFLDQLARVLRAHQVCETRWLSILPLCLSAEAAEWVEHAISPLNQDWSCARKAFLKHFEPAAWQHRAIVELMTMKMRRAESVQEFSDRFTQLIRKAGEEEHDPKLIEKYWLSLPANLRADVASSRIHSPPATVCDIIELALMHDAARMGAGMPENEGREERHAVQPARATACTYCKKLGHTSQECRARPRLQPTGMSAGPREPRKPIVCFTCGKPGHISPECPRKQMRKDQISAKAVRVQESGPHEEEQPDTASVQDFFKMARNVQALSVTAREHGTTHDAPGLWVTISVHGKDIQAYVDTGAVQSFLHPEVVRELKLEVVPKPGNVILAAEGVSIPRLGQTPSVKVEHGAKALYHTFEIMPLFDNTQCLLGQDLFSKLGFAISLPLTPSMLSTERDEGTPDPIACSPVDPIAIPNSVQAQEKLRAALSPALERNQALTPGTFCNVPDSVVRLDTGEHLPSFIRQYPIPHAAEQAVTDKVENWMQDGVIQLAPAGNAWNSPLVVVPKKDEHGNKVQWRICLDPRAINKMLPDDKFPLPLVSDIFNQLAGATIFTTLDLKESYHQFQLYPQDRHKTSFSWKQQQYCFVGCPFGLKPLSSIFQRVMSRILQEEKNALVFIDDIIVFSQSAEDHAKDVTSVINKLTRANLALRTHKCHFGCQALTLLGHQVSSTGIALDKEKVRQAQGIPTPQTGTDVERFLGLTNYFRNFIPCYASLAAPLEALRKEKSVRSKWSQACEQAFVTLKSVLSVAPVLHHPDFSLPFEVATDASGTGVGAALYQKKQEKMCYILFAAKALSKSEQNYSATKRELLAIVFALKKFHYYLWGQKFTLHTDHKALCYLFSQKHVNAMMSNWLDTLLAYDFHIAHMPGILNILPDALSRLFPTTGESATTHERNKQRIVCAAMQSQRALDPLSEGEKRAHMEKVHLLGHFGHREMAKRLEREGVQWKGMVHDCEQAVKACLPCQKFNIGKHGFHPLTPIHASLPWDHVATDTAGPFPQSPQGYKYLLVFVCVCTRFTLLKPLKDKSAAAVAIAMLEVFTTLGFPKILQSDNGTEFVNEVVNQMAASAQIDKRLVTPYHPRANGLAERKVQTATTIIKKLLEGEHSNWSAYLPIAQLAMNVKTTALHNCSPFALMLGRSFAGLQDFTQVESRAMSEKQIMEHARWMHQVIYPEVERVAQAQQGKEVERFSKKNLIKSNKFSPGSIVMAREPTRANKLEPIYEGPYRIIRRNRGGAYEVQDTTGQKLQRRLPPAALKLVASKLGETAPIFEVQAILDHRGPPHGREYLTQWKGYAKESNSWELAGNFVQKKAISEYWRRLKEQNQVGSDHSI